MKLSAYFPLSTSSRQCLIIASVLEYSAGFHLDVISRAWPVNEAEAEDRRQKRGARCDGKDIGDHGKKILRPVRVRSESSK